LSKLPKLPKLFSLILKSAAEPGLEGEPTLMEQPLAEAPHAIDKRRKSEKIILFKKIIFLLFY
jgi:hypothetical protein